MNRVISDLLEIQNGDDELTNVNDRIFEGELFEIFGMNQVKRWYNEMGLPVRIEPEHGIRYLFRGDIEHAIRRDSLVHSKKEYLSRLENVKQG